MYSTISGPIPLATMAGTAPVTSSSVGNGASTVAAWAGRGWRRRVASVTRARVPSEPDDELGQVVAAGRLHELAAGADDLAGAQDGLEPEHLVAGHAVLDGPHPAGVGGHVAAQAGRALAGEDRVDETRAAAVASSSSVQGDPGLDHGHVVVRVDLEDGRHPLEARPRRPPGLGTQRAGQAGARAPGGDGHAQLGGQPAPPPPPRRRRPVAPPPPAAGAWR